ncbi:hypothetical protein [[Clostridium] dakarense]|nr:hypothetical protein [[Clostridium] dakarense]
MNEETKISLERASQLKSRIEDYISIKSSIPKGIEKQKEIESRKKKY